MPRLAPTALLILLACALAVLGAVVTHPLSAPVVPDAAAGAPAATFAVFGDVNVSGRDTPAAVFGYVCAGIRGSGAGVALNTGDALNDIADTSVSTAVGRWRKYLAVETAGLGSTIVTWRTAGDNDRLDVPARLSAWNQVFTRYPTTPDATRRWYARSLKGLHVIFLNTAYAGHMGSIGYVSETSAGNSAEARWLVRDLRAVTAGSGRRTIIVVMHYPLVNGKTTKPYAGARKAEATALQALFAKYGVDMVLAGDTHVYRRTVITVVKAGVRRGVPYIQIPPAGTPPRSFGTSSIPALVSREAGWAPLAGYRGFLKLRYDATRHKLSVSVFKVAVGDGAVSAAKDQKANANTLGGTFADIPEGSRPL